MHTKSGINFYSLKYAPRTVALWLGLAWTWWWGASETRPMETWFAPHRTICMQTTHGRENARKKGLSSAINNSACRQHVPIRNELKSSFMNLFKHLYVQIFVSWLWFASMPIWSDWAIAEMKKKYFALIAWFITVYFIPVYWLWMRQRIHMLH